MDPERLFQLQVSTMTFSDGNILHKSPHTDARVLEVIDGFMAQNTWNIRFDIEGPGDQVKTLLRRVESRVRRSGIMPGRVDLHAAQDSAGGSTKMAYYMEEPLRDAFRSAQSNTKVIETLHRVSPGATSAVLFLDWTELLFESDAPFAVYQAISALIDAPRGRYALVNGFDER